MLDLYEIWFDLKPGVSDMTLVEKLTAYLTHLKQGGLLEGHRLSRRKLGLGPGMIGEFHLTMEFRDLAQLDAAFQRVAARRDPEETVHFGVNALVTKATFALYRDFPDPVRHVGQERF